MKKIKFNKVSKIILAFVFTLGLAGIIYAVVLPFTPDLGVATTFGVLSGTFSNSSTPTTITGDLGYTTGPATAPTLNGNLHTDTTDSPVGSVYTDAGADQAATLSDLNSQDCTFTFPDGAVNLATETTHVPTYGSVVGEYYPGVYCTTATSAASIGTAGINLKGAGTYVFRINGALTTVKDSHVTLDGASECDVFWTPTEATTIGEAGSSNISFKGTVIDDSGITVYEAVKWIGRALAFGGIVTIANPDVTITVPTCTLPHLTVTKVVVGGSKLATAFPLFIDGVSVTTDVAKEVSVGSHTVTETTDSNYTQTFSASCPGGIISLASGLDQTCTITNTYITPASSGGGGGYSIIYGCTDPIATNYNAFSASKPELCIYKPTITILSNPVVVAPIIPKFPKTGFPPRGEGDSFFDFLFSNILNLFR